MKNSQQKINRELIEYYRQKGIQERNDFIYKTFAGIICRLIDFCKRLRIKVLRKKFKLLW